MSAEQAQEYEAQGLRLSEDGQYFAASHAFNMAAELFRHAAQDGSVEAVIQYAAQLNNLGLCLGKLNRYGDAVVHLDGAATIIEDFLPNNPGLGQYYAATLASLAGALAEIGEFDRAMATTEQVIGFRRSAVEPGPLQVDPELAKALRQHAHVRMVAERELESAFPTATEAASIYQELAAADPSRFNHELYLAYDILAGVLDGLGRRDDAAQMRSWLADKTY